eukprot:6344693-Alexandrium_andersonii.AAC.1
MFTQSAPLAPFAALAAFAAVATLAMLATRSSISGRPQPFGPPTALPGGCRHPSPPNWSLRCTGGA